MKTKNESLNPKNRIQKLTAMLPAVVALLALPAMAQTMTNSPTAPQNFFQTAANYFTSANTNYSWSGNTLEVAVGADYMSSVNWANYLEVQYDLGKFGIEAKMRNAGIAGTVDSAEAGIEGGYDLDRRAPLIEPRLILRDKLTPNTFLGLALSLPVWTNGKPVNTVPDIGIETGFTY